jgi:hypothetical protein
MIFLQNSPNSPNLFRKFSLLTSTAVATLFLALLGISPVEAAPGKAADFNKYCRTKYPNSVYQIDRTRWGPRHICRQTGAGGATKQGIDYAEACRLTTGSRRYRKNGQSILCNASKGKTRSPKASTKSKADLNQYCRVKYPNSSYRAQKTRWGLRHICRQVNAGGYTNQPINLSDACRRTNGSRKFTKIGNGVYCGRSRAVARSNRKRTPIVRAKRRSLVKEQRDTFRNKGR